MAPDPASTPFSLLAEEAVHVPVGRGEKPIPLLDLDDSTGYSSRYRY
jgi:hypothetical protein